MTKNYFELVRERNQLTIDSRYIERELVPGCTLSASGDHEPETIKRFEREEDALEALKAYESDVRFVGVIRGSGRWVINVEEYRVEDHTYEIDEDGEEQPAFCECFWVCGTSRMPEEISLGGHEYRWIEAGAHSRYEFVDLADAEEDEDDE